MHEDSQVAVAELVWTGTLEDAFAVVKQPAHARFLSEQCRLVGVAIETSDGRSAAANGGDTNDIRTAPAAALLRLQLEEIYVGLSQGFLVLQQQRDTCDSNVDALCSALVRAVSQVDEMSPATASTAPSTLQLSTYGGCVACGP